MRSPSDDYILHPKTPKKTRPPTPKTKLHNIFLMLLQQSEGQDKQHQQKIIWQLMWMMTFLLTWVVPVFFHIHTHKFHLFPSKSLFGPIKSMVAGFTYSMVVAVEWDININQYHHGSGPQAKNLSWKVMVTETRGEIRCGIRIAAGQVELWCFLLFYPKKMRCSKNLVCPKETSFESSLSSTKTCQCWRSSWFSHGIESCNWKKQYVESQGFDPPIFVSVRVAFPYRIS